MRDERIARTPRPASRRRARRALVAALLVAALAALAASAAQAVIVTIGGERVSYEPLVRRSSGALPNARPKAKRLSKKPLEYNGGRVMTSNTNYAIYWDPSGGAAFPAGYESGINRYFEDVAHDSGGLLNTDSALTQYYGKGDELANYESHFGGALADTDPYPPNGCAEAEICLTEEQIRAEIKAFVQAHSLPMDLEHEYFLFTPQGVESCHEAEGHVCSAGAQNATYCAYHNYIELSKGTVIVFASDPYVSGLGCGDETNRPNGNPSDETISGGLAHEHSESVTDPQLDAWYDAKGNEVADKCRVGNPEVEYGTPLGTVGGSYYNEVINGDYYWYQQVWSNEVSACTQRQLQVPAIKKLKPKAGPPTGGTAVTFTGTGFMKGATVHFGEADATEVIYVSPTSIVAITPPGLPGKVEVTVTTVGGTSAITKKTHFKYKSH